MNDEQRATIDRWRKRQIYCVAVGNLVAILFLIGVALNSRLLIGLAGSAFLLCLGGIFMGGFLAAQAAKSSS